MAVTLTIYDLQQPTGELTESLFPGGDLSILVAGWLGQATALVTANTAVATANHDLAAAAWVYHRAYDHVAQRLASSPVRVATSLDGSVSKEMAQDQRKFWLDKSKEKLNDYKALETEADSDIATVPFFFGRVRASTASTTVVY